MQITNATPQDIETIFKLYDQAIEFQKKVADQHWTGFELSRVEQEISENRLWKIIENDEVVCIFLITFSDLPIWGERDYPPGIYLHRIVTNPSFRGRGYVKAIVDWLKNYAAQLGRNFIRMDTWGDNQKLTDYYQSCGFSFLGVITLQSTDGLPKHYLAGSRLSLFEINLSPSV